MVGESDHNPEENQNSTNRDSDIELVGVEDDTDANNVVITTDEIADAQSKDGDIRKIHNIYRSTPCQVTKFTPYLLDKGREPRFPTHVFEGKRAEVTETEYAEHLQEVLPKIWDAAIAARMEALEIAAEHYNERHGKPIDVVTGDLVFCEDHRYNATNLPTKMLPKCTGPWKILRVTESM